MFKPIGSTILALKSWLLSFRKMARKKFKLTRSTLLPAGLLVLILAAIVSAGYYIYILNLRPDNVFWQTVNNHLTDDQNLVGLWLCQGSLRQAQCRPNQLSQIGFDFKQKAIVLENSHLDPHSLIIVDKQEQFKQFRNQHEIEHWYLKESIYRISQVEGWVRFEVSSTPWVDDLATKLYQAELIDQVQHQHLQAGWQAESLADSQIRPDQMIGDQNSVEDYWLDFASYSSPLLFGNLTRSDRASLVNYLKTQVYQVDFANVRQFEDANGRLIYEYDIKIKGANLVKALDQFIDSAQLDRSKIDDRLAGRINNFNLTLKIDAKNRRMISLVNDPDQLQELFIKRRILTPEQFQWPTATTKANSPPRSYQEILAEVIGHQVFPDDPASSPQA